METYPEILKKLIPGLLEIFQRNIIKIVLYGSVARGSQTLESDIDIAVILPHYNKEMHNNMLDFIVSLELEYNIVLSVLLIEYQKFQEWEDIMPFYQNIKKEGVQLWPAA